MPRFASDLRQRAMTRLAKKGYSKVGEQHNGCLFVGLSDSDMLMRKVVTHTGKIITYLPRQATDRELQLYRLA